MPASLAPFRRCAQASAAAYAAAAKANALVATTGLTLPAKVASELKTILSEFWSDERITPRIAIDRIAAVAR